jgi:hypothetical protein
MEILGTHIKHPKQFSIRAYNEVLRKIANNRLNDDNYERKKKPPKFKLTNVPNKLKK